MSCVRGRGGRCIDVDIPAIFDVNSTFGSRPNKRKLFVSEPTMLIITSITVRLHRTTHWTSHCETYSFEMSHNVTSLERGGGGEGLYSHKCWIGVCQEGS